LPAIPSLAPSPPLPRRTVIHGTLLLLLLLLLLSLLPFLSFTLFLSLDHTQ